MDSIKLSLGGQDKEGEDSGARLVGRGGLSMAVTTTTSSLSRDAVYQKELADYKAKIDRWARMPAAPEAAPIAADQNAVQNRAQEAYPAPPAPQKKKKKKKSCGAKVGGVFKKVVQVAVPTVVGFFTGGPAGAAMGAVQGVAGLAQKQPQRA